MFLNLTRCNENSFVEELSIAFFDKNRLISICIQLFTKKKEFLNLSINLQRNIRPEPVKKKDYSIYFMVNSTAGPPCSKTRREQRIILHSRVLHIRVRVCVRSCINRAKGLWSLSLPSLLLLLHYPSFSLLFAPARRGGGMHQMRRRCCTDQRSPNPSFVLPLVYFAALVLHILSSSSPSNFVLLASFSLSLFCRHVDAAECARRGGICTRRAVRCKNVCVEQCAVGKRVAGTTTTARMYRSRPQKGILMAGNLIRRAAAVLVVGMIF